MSEGNPYMDIVDTLRTDSEAHRVDAWRLGIVETVDPLTVSIDGKIFKEKDLLVNAALLDYERELEQKDIEGTLEGDPHDLEVEDGSLQSTATLKGYLESGDRVVLLQQQDAMLYVVLCKAVDP